MVTFESARFKEAEDVHAEFFEVFGKDELTRWMRARERLSITSKDIDSLFG